LQRARYCIFSKQFSDSILIDKTWSRVKAPDSSLGERAAAYFVTNIMKAKKKFGMGLNKTEKKGRKKILKNKMKKTHLSTVINVATKTLKKQTIRHYECN